MVGVKSLLPDTLVCLTVQGGPGSVATIATGYRLDGPGIESRWGGQTDPGAHPASCTKGTVFFPGVKSGRGVTLTPHPFPVSWSRKSTAIPLLHLWAVRSVQSLSDCTRVHFTFTLRYKSMRQRPTPFRPYPCHLVT